jgi:protein-disulfide isomerase
MPGLLIPREQVRYALPVTRARLLSLVLLPALALPLPSCRPSKAELAAVTVELQRVRTAQNELQTRVEQLEQQESVADAQAQHEVDSLVGGLTDVARRLVVLEEQAAKRDKERPTFGKPDPAAVYHVTVGDSHVKGPVDALVTIVMWTDYQCPYCARVQATLSQLEEAYGRDVRFVHKHNPLGFHPQAMPAAIAAEAAGRQGKFWPMNGLLFEHQKELSPEQYRRLAKKLRLKLRRFDEDLEDPKLRERVVAEQTQGMMLGARGTPAFFVNGRFLSGAQPFENFKKLIDEELAKARALIDRGVPRMQVYEVTIAEGKTKA